MRYPTVYMREPIGVDGALEAVEAIHFCSPGCREQWQNWHPDKAGTDAIGEDESTCDGEVCNSCGKELDSFVSPFCSSANCASCEFAECSCDCHSKVTR